MNVYEPLGGWDADAATEYAPHMLTILLGDAEPSAARVPAHYGQLFQKFSNLHSANELEALVLDPLVAAGFLTAFQASRVVDTLYTNNILPPSTQENFNQALGLVALELGGSSDYVTLQFKMNLGLPPLPDEVVTLLMDEADPLTAQLKSAALDDKWDDMMADHSAISLEIEGPAAASTPPDDGFVTKYVQDIRGRFKPLMGDDAPVQIKKVPEREGLLFKHINYAISHELRLGQEGPKRVVRRYSDFVWLLEFLLKKYPFRVIPGLPPKKFTGMSLFANVSRSVPRQPVFAAPETGLAPFSQPACAAPGFGARAHCRDVSHGAHGLDVVAAAGAHRLPARVQGPKNLNRFHPHCVAQRGRAVSRAVAPRRGGVATAH